MSNDKKDRERSVGDPSFWDKRIHNANMVGNIRHSIYEVPESMWEALNVNHKRILNGIISNEDRVLDAGCGYGRASTFIPAYRYVGVDQTPEFIRLAQHFYPDQTFVCSKLEQLPYEDNSFDWSVCISLMIMVVQNQGWFVWEKIQNELLRVSKNGIICLEYGEGDTDTTSDTYYIINKHTQ